MSRIMAIDYGSEENRNRRYRPIENYRFSSDNY